MAWVIQPIQLVFNGLIWTLKGMLIHLLDDLVYFEEGILLDVDARFP